MAGHKYKGYINTGRPLKISFDVDGNDTPDVVTTGEVAPAPRYTGVGKGLCFMSLCSGSSGNCAYLGTPRGGILIDAGIKPPPKSNRKRKKSEEDVLNLNEAFATLKKNGVDADMVKGVLLTHAHQDHMRCLYDAVKYSDRLFYTSRAIFNQLKIRKGVSCFIEDYLRQVSPEHQFHILDMEITPFVVSHDVKCIGFCIEYEGERFVVATDMGIITDRAAHYMSIANYLMIECNYDKDMLLNGRYPQMLKDRVMSEKGHLDNTVAAQFVADHYHEGLHNVFLCHLSKDNNTEEIALATMRNALESRGISVGDGSNDVSQRDRNVQIYALPRYTSSAWFVLA
jgi:Metal-dependent hydrolases of the beta-lactamase superfamily I